MNKKTIDEVIQIIGKEKPNYKTDLNAYRQWRRYREQFNLPTKRTMTKTERKLYVREYNRLYQRDYRRGITKRIRKQQIVCQPTQAGKKRLK